MSSLKSLVLILAIGILLAGSVTAAAVWQSTGWITNGATISATKIKAHLDYLHDQIASASPWSTSGSRLYYNSGNVGIGTSAPSQKLHVTGNLRVDGRHIYLGGTQDLYGDNSAYLYFDSNHDSVTSIQLRDKQNTRYGYLYGSGNGRYFGLLDGDGNWSYLTDKDKYTQFRINNKAEFTLYPSYIRAHGNRITEVGTPSSASDAATKAYVDSKQISGATGPRGSTGARGATGPSGITSKTVVIGSTVSPSSVKCYGRRLYPTGVTVLSGKWAILYSKTDPPKCTYYTYQRAYNGSWGSCSKTQLSDYSYCR